MSAAIHVFRLSIILATFCLAFAQGPAARAQSDAPPPGEVADALTRILAAPDNLAEINRFIGAGALPADGIATRARALIRGLRAQREATETPRYLDAVVQIAGLTSRALSSTAVIGLAVASDYRPENAVVALDFGPPDGAIMPGFERVVRGDPRIGGRFLALRRPDANALLADGMAGIEKIALSVEPGDYRIILITQNLSDPAVSRLPFGSEIRINGVPTRIERSDFRRWRYGALLATGPAQLAASGSYRIGTLPEDGGRLFALQQGGAVILESKTTSGKLIIEFSSTAGDRTYLTGLLVERLDRISNLVLSPPGRDVIVPPGQRLELEALVLAEAARAVEGIEPALGQTPQDNTVVSQDR